MMMEKRLTVLVILVTFVLGGHLAAQPLRPAPANQAVENHFLFKQACREDPERYKYAIQQGAKFVLTPDRRSFMVVWYPPSTQKSTVKPPMIFSLHGHASFAFDEFFLWHQTAAKEGFGIVALQWWFGKGEAPLSYYQPNDVYRIFDQFCKSESIPMKKNLLHGFSRGSANIYGVKAFDSHTRNNYFLLTIANAGKAETDFPINQEIKAGKFGSIPFQGSHWVLFAGGKDPHPELSGIQGMSETEIWVKKYGGTVDLFIADQEAGHGGFHLNPRNIGAAVGVFKNLLGVK